MNNKKLRVEIRSKMPEVSPYLIIPFVTVIVSQVLKFAVYAFSNEIDFGKLLERGGKISTRIAAVVAIMVTALAVDGLAASVAGLTVAFGALYIWEKLDLATLRQLLVGALIGLFTGIILSVEYWRDDLDWLFAKPSTSEVNTEFIIFGAVLVLSELMNFAVRRKSVRKLPTSRKLSRAFRLTLTLPALFGLFFTFAQRETLGMFDIRIWTYLVYAWIVVGTAWAWWSTYRHAKAHLKEEADHFKKAKEKTKTKRKKSTKKTKRKK
jgi:hypothetical protein